MSQISDKIKNELINPALDNLQYSTYGFIEQYNKINNTASISFVNPITKTKEIQNNVELPVNSNSISFSGPYKGDEVLILFSGNGCKRPKIVSLISSTYGLSQREMKQKHQHQGTYIPNTLGAKKIKNETSVNILDFYKGSNSKNKSLNINDFFEYLEQNVAYYDTSEIGLTHPNNKSTIKIKDDGSIDIFAFLDNGIRINPVNNFISMFTSKLKVLVYDIFHVSSQKEIKLEAKKDVIIKSRTDVKIDSNHLYINHKEIKDLIKDLSKKEAEKVVGPIQEQLEQQISSLNYKIERSKRNEF